MADFSSSVHHLDFQRLAPTAICLCIKCLVQVQKWQLSTQLFLSPPIDICRYKYIVPRSTAILRLFVSFYFVFCFSSFRSIDGRPSFTYESRGKPVGPFNLFRPFPPFVSSCSIGAAVIELPLTLNIFRAQSLATLKKFQTTRNYFRKFVNILLLMSQLVKNVHVNFQTFSSTFTAVINFLTFLVGERWDRKLFSLFPVSKIDNGNNIPILSRSGPFTMLREMNSPHKSKYADVCCLTFFFVLFEFTRECTLRHFNFRVKDIDMEHWTF